MLNLDKKQIEMIDRAFVDITNSSITIYNDAGQRVYISPKLGCPYMKYFKKNTPPDRYKQFEAHCPHIDQEAMNICKTTQSYYAHTCHYGLTKLYCPIFHNNVLLGYIKLSRYILEENKESAYQKTTETAQEFSVNEKDLLKIFDSIPKIKSDSIKSLTQIMEMCVCYLLYYEILTKQDTSLSFFLETYIHEHLADDLSTTALCNYLSISKTTLYKLSLSSFNCSISEYVERARFEHAKKLLSETEESINSIARKVGFFDPNYFSKRFKQLFGVSPSEFRKKKTKSSTKKK